MTSSDLKSSGVVGLGQNTFCVTMMYYATLFVPDLDEAEAWFARVFGRPGISLESLMKRDGPKAGYPSNSSSFILVNDALIDAIDPKRYVVNGKQVYESATQGYLKNTGWYVEGMRALFAALKRSGFQVLDPRGALVEGDELPVNQYSAPSFHTAPADTGQQVQFKEHKGLNAPFYPTIVDPRTEPGWKVPPARPGDPLGLERCSHHTILTSDRERALRLVVGLLGGEVIHEGLNEQLGTTSTYVHLAGSTVEYGVPAENAPVYANWAKNDPYDTYHGITWRVADLERAERHLETQGVRIAARSGDTIITEAASSLGIPWGFTTAWIPGDPRVGAE